VILTKKVFSVAIMYCILAGDAIDIRACPVYTEMFMLSVVLSLLWIRYLFMLYTSQFEGSDTNTSHTLVTVGILELEQV